MPFYFFPHDLQGLANESSNHSYGSLGSSSDKESEVDSKLVLMVRRVIADEMKQN